MSKLPKPTSDVPNCNDVSLLAPKFREALTRVLARMAALGHDAVVFETLRTQERQQFLYGFGREYDDGRGVVTNSPSMSSWHNYGLAADVISRSAEWDASAEFWNDLRDACTAEKLMSGGRWSKPDRPHVQWWCDGMHISPSPNAAKLYAEGGIEAVWRAVHAE
jgi:peptidoglycan L-alanyl-D-glutamate endopeptidase CwlK